MKQALSITGRVELTRQEVTEAVFSFLKQKGFKSSKAVYLPSDDKFEGVVVEVVGAALPQQEIPKFGKEIKHKFQPEGFVRKNVGVYDTMRELLNEAFKKRTPGQVRAEVNFKTLLEDIVFMHPGMDAKKLYVYLYDKRQLPNIDFYPKTDQIIIKGEVNH